MTSRILPILGLVLAITALGVLFWSYSSPEITIMPTRTLLIDGTAVHVAVANTPESRAKGLSGTSSLAEGEGMLFVFDDDDRHMFWMKDMVFSIDILWADRDGRVVHIEQSVSPETFPQTFAPPVPARYALEVPAGFAAARDIKIGSVLKVSQVSP
ncbi:MAG TPA: DUF192 domain-containing protein [Candidatus Paceibacterota bacterium]|nr:DUF192 domain-containing protein [Candidatus Paceibacterota bacterium]